jgi:uncharacterized protein YbjT (DUF2867 family)
MNVILFGATGMVGQGVLRECLRDPDVQRVVSVVRSATGQQHPKLRELIHRDFHDFSSIERDLVGLDACFFCLGIASAGMTEADYTSVTYGITVAAGETIAKLNPTMTFIFVSGASSDSTERGRVMWARVKGKAENAVLRLPIAASYVFRPGFIRPLHGATSKTRLYRVFYKILAPVLPLIAGRFPNYVTTTEQMGRAMLGVAKRGAPTRVLETRDINAVR